PLCRTTILANRSDCRPLGLPHYSFPGPRGGERRAKPVPALFLSVTFLAKSALSTRSFQIPGRLGCRKRRAVWVRCLGGQKTPPFAGAKRRGRNREEAESYLIEESNRPSSPCQELFWKSYKLTRPPSGQMFRTAGRLLRGVRQRIE